MSQVHAPVKEAFRLGEKRTKTLVGVIAIGLAALLATFLTDPKRAWANVLLDNMYFIGIAVTAGFFLALQYVTKSSWSEVLRRVPEAITAFLPWGFLLMLLLIPGMPALYHWVDGVHHDGILAQKAPYLNMTAFLVRMGIVFGGWILLTRALVANSRKEDETGEAGCYRRNIRNSCLFIVFFAYSFSVASIDWLMSIDPHWYSTIYGVYSFSGAFVGAIAVITVMVIVLKELGYLAGVNENHFHDLGKLMFAFSMFWAYIWFSQFLLIWYGNMPEETVYFHTRMTSDFDWLFYFNLFLNFAVPFFVLLPRGTKRNPAIIKRVAIALLIGHWLDLYVLIAPGALGVQAHIGFPEVLITLGYAAAFILVVGKALEKAPLVPLQSPLMAECLAHHQ